MPDGRIETTEEIQQALKDLGWPIKVDGDYGETTQRAVTDFQRGFAFYNLLIDGHAGPQTCAALSGSLYLGGKASPHFTFREFASKGNHWIRTNRHLIRGLEQIRERYGPFSPVSGYRDPSYNHSIGSVPNSQHVYGNASDIPASLGVTLSAVKRLGAFSGLGIKRSNGRVIHVDVRHLGPNTTGGTVSNPTVWYYAS